MGTRTGAPRPGRRLAAALVALALGACSYPIRTAYDADPKADFTRYQSYAWIMKESAVPPAVRHGGYVSPLDEQRIVAAVDSELAAKGYREVDTLEQADLVVSYAIGTERKTRETQVSTPGSGRYYPNDDRGGWYTNSEVFVQTHMEGTLTIQFYDRATRQAVWVGRAQKRLDKADDSEKVIRKAVSSVLADFPSRI